MNTKWGQKKAMKRLDEKSRDPFYSLREYRNMNGDYDFTHVPDYRWKEKKTIDELDEMVDEGISEAKCYLAYASYIGVDVGRPLCEVCTLLDEAVADGNPEAIKFKRELLEELPPRLRDTDIERILGLKPEEIAEYVILREKSCISSTSVLNRLLEMSSRGDLKAKLTLIGCG